MKVNLKNSTTSAQNNAMSVETKVIEQNSLENIDWTGTPWRERTFSHPERTITIGTSCSGIGAPEQALRQLGLNSRIMFAGDIDKNVKKSYFANYDISEEDWHNDLFQFDATKYKGKISIFIAGICCQTFSKSGKQKGVKDKTRGQLFKAFTRVIRECEPEIWIMENVDNMLTLHKGEDWNEIKAEFDTLGYDIHYQVLNAVDYNLPQNRNRLFCIGFKRKTDFLFPAPVELDKSVYDLLEDTTPCLRQLTPRETLRLQGFSDDFKIVVPKTSAYKQAGNSIAVDVLKAIFRQMDITRYGFQQHA